MNKLIGLVMLLAACVVSSTEIPVSAHTVHGTITQINAQSSVLIEGDAAKCERYWFRLGSDTRVLQVTETGEVEAGQLSDLKVGKTARAWANGPIAESCPAQTSAGVILLYYQG